MSTELRWYGFCPLMLVGMNGVALYLASSEAPKGWLHLQHSNVDYRMEPFRSREGEASVSSTA